VFFFATPTLGLVLVIIILIIIIIILEGHVVCRHAKTSSLLVGSLFLFTVKQQCRLRRKSAYTYGVVLRIGELCFLSLFWLTIERKYKKILIVYVVYSYKYVSVPLTLTH
jgi:hypothetical protein